MEVLWALYKTREITTLTINDIQGRIICSNQQFKRKHRNRNIKPLVYFLNITTNNKTVNKKIFIRSEIKN